MRSQGLIAKGEVRRLARLWVLFVLVCAVVNVPFAVTRIRSRTTPPGPVVLDLRGPALKREWISSTPHATPWPAPNYLLDYSVFGRRDYDMRTLSASRDSLYSMHVQHLGWPLPVLEQKQMWWDWDDPALKGPEPDPRPRLMPLGMMLNPVIVGTAALLVLVGPWYGFVVLRRARRGKRGQCLACGYFIRTGSAKCPECGAAIVGAAIANSAETSGEKAEASVGTGV